MHNTVQKTEGQLKELLDALNVQYGDWLNPVSSLLQELKTNDRYLKVSGDKLKRYVDVMRVRCYH